jgi:hypothetical protein
VRNRKNYLFASLFTMLFWALAPRLVAQNTGSIAGTIKDASGAIVPGATVALVSPQSARPVTTTATALGVFEFHGLAPGSYSVTVDMSGFAHYEQGIEVGAAQPRRLSITLAIATVQQDVDVTSDTPHVDVSPENNTSAISINGTNIDAFSDDPDELETQLLALAGPSAGPNGGQLYVDGFTVESGGLPPKNSILAIRVNQNPFSPQFDRLGYGRVEVLTKPGTDSYHGRFNISGNDLAFDTKDPLAASEPGYYSLIASADVSGPLGKKGSFYYTLQHRNIQNDDVIDAYQLNPSGAQIPFDQTLTAPSHLDTTGPRVDFALSKNNIFSATYQFSRQIQQNLGIGQFALASQGYAFESLQNSLRIKDTQIVGERFVNELSFQGQDQSSTDTPASLAPERDVIGGFIDGGNSSGALNYHHHHLEEDDLATLSLSRHTISFGGRLRTVQEPYVSPGNFNGTYTFPSLTAFAAGTPSQFTLTAGVPLTRLFSEDTGVFVSDDWRAGRNVMVSYGLRFETQNYIHNHADWAPRLGVAWGLGKSNSSPKTVLRAGYGIFYDRFSQQLQLQEMELNGVRQTEYILNNPSPGFYATYYPNLPTPAALIAAGATTTVYRPDPNLHAPYTLQSAVGLERQISKAITVSATWLNSRGNGQLISDNINAPLPGTYNPAVPGSGTRPNPAAGNIYQYQSAAIFRQNQLIANANVRARRFSLFGTYTLTYANSDTAGASSFPDNQYDIAEDYGRAAFDIRSRAVAGGTITLKYGVVLSPLMNVQSGTPYNFTLGQDLLGTTIFNQRPSYATSSTPAADIVKTPYGSFNINPGPSDPLIPINLGQGPHAFVFNLRASKVFPFGREGGGGSAGGGIADTGGGGGPSGAFRPGTAQASGGGGLGGRGLGGGGGGGGSSSSGNRRYSLTLSAEARNLFNDVNLGTPVGTVTSPLLGTSNSLQGGVYSFSGTNRRIDLQLGFNF